MVESFYKFDEWLASDLSKFFSANLFPLIAIYEAYNQFIKVLCVPYSYSSKFYIPHQTFALYDISSSIREPSLFPFLVLGSTTGIKRD